MFLFTLGTFQEELAKFSPGVAGPFAKLSPETRSEIEAAARKERGILVWGDCPAVERLYASLPSISIDYAVMEKSGRVAMVKAGFEWYDVGSWDEVARLLPAESGLVVEEAAKGNTVHSDIPRGPLRSRGSHRRDPRRQGPRGEKRQGP